MNQPSVFWALVRKDLYILRAFIISAIVAGVVCVGLAMTGRTGFAVGGILFLTANIASAIFIAMYSLMVERKEQSRLFALSLPVSGVQHDRAKLLGAGLAFAIPWTVLSLLAVSMFLFAPDAPRGMVVYALLVQGFIMAMFSVVLAALFVVTAEAVSGITILGVNISFSLFMIQINQREISLPFRGEEIIWTPYAQQMLAGEAGVIILAIVFTLLVTARRRDHL